MASRLEDFIAAHRPANVSYIARKFHYGTDTAEDIVQDAAVRMLALDSLGRLPECNLAAYFRRACHHTAINHHRTVKRQNDADLDFLLDAGFDPAVEPDCGVLFDSAADMIKYISSHLTDREPEVLMALVRGGRACHAVGVSKTMSYRILRKIQRLAIEYMQKFDQAIIPRKLREELAEQQSLSV